MFTFMQAIDKLPASVVSGPLSDPEKLRSILKHHMVHGKYCLTDYPGTIVSVQVSLCKRQRQHQLEMKMVERITRVYLMTCSLVWHTYI